MMPREHGMGSPEFSAVEQLLSEAAVWEPDTPAPEGLAGRALAFELERQDRERILRDRERRAGLFATFFMGASAVSATVALAFFHLSPSAVSPAAIGPQGEQSRTIVTVLSNRTPTARVSPVRPAGPAARPLRVVCRFAGTTASRPRVKKAAVAAPPALWREETVRREIAGVLSTGWLIQHNPEDGSLIVTPGVLEVQGAAQEAACENPALPTGEAAPLFEPASPAAGDPREPGPLPENEDPASPATPLLEGEPTAPSTPEN